MPIAISLHDITITTMRVFIWIPIILGIIHYKKLDTNIRIVLALTTLSAITEIATYIASSILHRYNTHFINGYIILEICFIALFFYRIIHPKTFRILILSAFIPGTIWSVVDIIQNGIYVFSDVASSLSSAMSMLFSVFFFIDILKKIHLIRLENNPYFWIVTGWFFYSTTILIFISFKYIAFDEQGKALYLSIYPITYIFLTIFHIFIAIGILCQVRNST